MRATLQIVERDLGTTQDFYNIALDILIKPAQPATPIRIPIDHLLTLRQLPTHAIRLHARSARPLPTLHLPDESAAHAFLTALQAHVAFHPLAPHLLALEPHPRMRRAAPTLMPTAYPSPTHPHASEPPPDHFSALLTDLAISPRPPARPHNALIVTLLAPFAHVTRLVRELADQLSAARTPDAAHLHAAQSAALDVHARFDKSSSLEGELPPRLVAETPRGCPVSSEAWHAMMDHRACLRDPAVIRHAVFMGGVAPPLRASVWPFLLGVFPWLSCRAQRDEIMNEARSEFAALKARCDTVARDALLAAKEARADGDQVQVLKVRQQVGKDIVRTDRSVDMFVEADGEAIRLMEDLLNVYACYNPAIAYCQGMSDFLAPLIREIGLGDHALVFRCFVNLMEVMEANFRVDQTGMRAQLALLKRIVRAGDEQLAEFFEATDPDFYCCFRWIIVRFKREMAFQDAVRLWEILWAAPEQVHHLHIFVAAALLFAHRAHLLALPVGAFDELLRYVNDISMRIDVDFAIREGEACFRKLADVVSKSA